MKRLLCSALAALIVAPVVATAAPAGAAVPGGNGKIAYTRTLGENNEVFAINPDGGQDKTLTVAVELEFLDATHRVLARSYTQLDRYISGYDYIEVKKTANLNAARVTIRLYSGLLGEPMQLKLTRNVRFND